MRNMDTVRAKEYLVKRISAEETYKDLLHFPRYIEIETIHACNARCLMCTIDEWQRSDRLMKEELFQKIADEVIEHSNEIKRVTLYRDGEPLLDKKMPERIEMLKDGGIKSISISTNGGLLTESKAKDLLNTGLDIIIMSIDSLKKEVYESIRVGLEFEQVLENMIRFIGLRNRIRTETQIWFRMIRQANNAEEWPDYYDFWAPKLCNHDRVYYHNIFNWGGQLKDFNPVTKSYEPNLPCVALWSLLVIFCNGDVPLCNTDFNIKYPSGSVFNNSIQEIWQSQIMNFRRQLHLQNQKYKIDICKNCNVWDESPGGESVSAEYAEQIEIQVV